ncbi:type II toxin-antitoxin system VapB family antitoxin [Microbacterium marinum]|uniref:type II toxin-antitoxin system VapB family antitoxin n=1 Tax=Microbacterium marinum TaxID=421115 RepID=UPI00384FB292
MGLNIKNEDVHAAVRELAARLGVSQTSAVERAVREKLAAMTDDADLAECARRRRDAIEAAQEAYRGVDLWAIADHLYDPATGLPK